MSSVATGKKRAREGAIASTGTVQPNARTRHLRPGDPNFGRVRRPPLPERVGQLAAAVLGEERGALIGAVITGIKRGSIPAPAGRLVLERLLPPGRPTRLDLPFLDAVQDLTHSHAIIIHAVNEGVITVVEARLLQDMVREAWAARKEAEAAPSILKRVTDPEECKRRICEAGASYGMVWPEPDQEDDAREPRQKTSS